METYEVFKDLAIIIVAGKMCGIIAGSSTLPITQKLLKALF